MHIIQKWALYIDLAILLEAYILLVSCLASSLTLKWRRLWNSSVLWGVTTEIILFRMTPMITSDWYYWSSNFIYTSFSCFLTIVSHFSLYLFLPTCSYFLRLLCIIASYCLHNSYFFIDVPKLLVQNLVPPTCFIVVLIIPNFVQIRNH
jgi:hypothetical protein